MLRKKYILDPVEVPMFGRKVFLCRKTGNITDIKGGVERLLHVDKARSGNLITYEGKQHKTITIALNALGVEIPPNARISYNSNKAGFVIPSTIKIEVNSIQSEDECLLFKYNCHTKSNNANRRFKDKISATSILQVLRICKFSCYYCGVNLNPDDWHLDHCVPFAKNGRNVIENIAPSCPSCNTAKGTMTTKTFIKKCKAISLKHSP